MSRPLVVRSILALALAASSFASRSANADDDTAPDAPPVGPVPGDDLSDPVSPAPPPTEPKAPPPPAPTPDAPPKAAAVAAKESELPTIRELFTFRAGPVSFRPLLLVQAQAVPYAGEDSLALSGDAADSGGFRLRRGRLGAEVGLFDQGVGRVSVELGTREDGTARLHDAWLAYVGLPFAQLFAGAQTVPFSRTAMTSSASQALTERALAVRSMAPGQQVGVVGRGEIAEGAFLYDAGVFNGFSRGDQFFAGYLQNFAPLGNRFEGLAYVGRLATEPVGRLSPTIADETHESPRFGVGAGYFYSDGGARGIHAVGGDALLHALGFHLLGEVIFSHVSPKDAPSEPTAAAFEVSSLGVVGEAGYAILEELLGVNARFEYVDADMNVENEGDNWLLTGGASLMFLESTFKVQAEFAHREEIFGVGLANDSVSIQGQLSL